MEINKLISLFGKEYKNKEFIEFFSNDDFDIVADVKKWMNSDYYEDSESDVYAENIKKGYSLVFDDELDFFDIEDGRYGESGNYYFTCIHIYAQGVDEYDEYQDELINGINIKNTKEEVRYKLGNNYKRHDFLDVDIWENINGVKIFIDYKNKETPQIISLSLVKKNK